MIHHWKAFDLEITDFNYHYGPAASGETIPSQTSNLNHVEILNVSEKHIYGASLESF